MVDFSAFIKGKGNEFEWYPERLQELVRMDRYPLITVLTLSYNSTYIYESIQSVLEQSYPHIEYIWVNDATSDNSIQILKRITDEYPQRKADVRIVEHSRNKGLPTARNTGYLSP